jgi:hypothetical protein
MTYIEYSFSGCALWGKRHWYKSNQQPAVSAFTRINTSIQSSLFLFGACTVFRRSRSPRSLKRRSAAAGLLGLRVRITPEARMYVSCERCVLSGRGLCDEAEPSSIRALPTVCVCVIRCSSRLQLKCDGTRCRTGREVRGKLANGVDSQYPSHYLGTWCVQYYYSWCAHFGCR